MAQQEKATVEILHMTTPTGRKWFVVWNNRTGFRQVVRKLTVARDIEAHWISREALLQ